jgi:F-type H+-transporting ATPase subunit a
MNGILVPLLPVLASAEHSPLDHVRDHDLAFLTESLGITKHVLMMLLAAALCLMIFPMVARRLASPRPGRLAMLFEAILLFVRDEMARPFLGKDTEKFLPILWSFFFFILFCNLLGMIPGSATATGNISVTASLAAISLLIYHFFGIRENGLIHYAQANLLVGPWYLWPLMVPIEIVGHVIKPCALAIRLFANMVGGHIMLAVVVSFTAVFTLDNWLLGGAIAAVAAGGAVFLNFLELLVAFIQAFIFTFLTTVFLSMALHPEH